MTREILPSLPYRDRVAHALTEWDRQQSAKPRAGHNPYFLGIALGQLDYWDEYATPREFVLDCFNGRLVPFLLASLGLPKLTEDEHRRIR